MSRKQRIAHPLWEKYKVAIVTAVLGLLTVVTFAGVLRADFTNYDDNSYVTANRVIREGFTWNGLEYAFFPKKNFWHPLTWLSHMLDCQIYGSRAWGHHLTNLILHVGGVVFLFLALFGMTGALWRSALVTALYALHPLHVESVAWVAERKGILSSFFWMLSLFGYSRYVRQRNLGWYLFVFAAVVGALASKPNTITLPFTLLLLDVWPLQRWLLRGPQQEENLAPRPPAWLVVAEKVPMLAVAAWFGIVAAQYQSHVGAFDMLPDLSLYGRVSNALVSPTIYLRRYVWPSDLAVHYPHPGNGIPLWQPVLAASAYVGFALLGLWQIRRRPYLLIGWLWFLGTLVPVSGIVQIGSHGMADRYTDIPLIGIGLIVAWTFAEIARRSPRAQFQVMSVTVVALLVLALVSTVQTSYWRNSTVLFRHALEVTENNKMAHQCYAFMMEREKKPEEALYHFRQMTQIDPDDPYAHNFLGNSLYLYGRKAEAYEEFQKAVALKPDFPSALTSLGSMQIEQGEIDAGRANLLKAIELDPEIAYARRSYGNLLLAEGDLDGALAQFQLAVELEPERIENHQSLAIAIQRKKEATSAPARDPQP